MDKEVSVDNAVHYPRCPRCTSLNVKRHEQERPARMYYTCADCGLADSERAFVPPPKPKEPDTRSRGAMQALSALVGLASLPGPVYIPEEQSRADRGRVK